MKEVVSLPSSVTRISAAPDGGVRIIGNNRKIQEVFKLIGQVAEKDVTVLITGESGTGKELVARAIYHHSHRVDKPFMAVNCAAIPEALFESELFGYERGAFTGADRTYIGKFERCHEGTLFFDEIGDMSLRTQAKVLRVLQEGEFERLGSTETIKVRRAHPGRHEQEPGKGGPGGAIPRGPLLPAADHLDPPAAAAGPARRHPALVDYFVGRFAGEYGSPVRYVSDQAVRKSAIVQLAGQRPAVGKLPAPRGADVQGRRAAARAPPLRERSRCGGRGVAGDRATAGLRQRVDELVREILSSVGKRAHASVIDLVERSLDRPGPGAVRQQPGSRRPAAGHQPQHAAAPDEEVRAGDRPAQRHSGARRRRVTPRSGPRGVRSEPRLFTL